MKNRDLQAILSLLDPDIEVKCLYEYKAQGYDASGNPIHTLSSVDIGKVAMDSIVRRGNCIIIGRLAEDI